MNRDAVFLDLWRKIKDMGEEVQAKLLYIYLQDLPAQCTPESVMPLVYRPVYPPLTVPKEVVKRAMQVVAAELDRNRCMTRRDVVYILKQALSHNDEELVEDRQRGLSPSRRGDRYDEEEPDEEEPDEEFIEMVADVAARMLTESGRAAVVGGRLCLAAETGIEVVREEPDALIVRFRCRDGKTRTYVISPMETAEEEEEEGEVEEEL